MVPIGEFALRITQTWWIDDDHLNAGCTGVTGGMEAGAGRCGRATGLTSPQNWVLLGPMASLEFVARCQAPDDLISKSVQPANQFIDGYRIQRITRRWINVHSYLDDSTVQRHHPQVSVGQVSVARLVQGSEQ